MRISLSCPSQIIYCPWLVIHNVNRVRFVPMLVRSNWWLDFNETLWKNSILREDAYILFHVWVGSLTPELVNSCIICLTFDIIAYNFVIIEWIVFILRYNYICDITFKAFKLNLTLTFKWLWPSRSNNWILLDFCLFVLFIHGLPSFMEITILKDMPPSWPGSV